MSEIASPSPASHSAPPESRGWDGRTRSGLGIRLMFWLFRVLGPLFTYTLLYPVVFYYLLVAGLGRHGRASRDYLRRALGAGGLKLWWLNYRHFLSFGRVLLDRAYVFAGMLGRFQFERENAEAFNGALALGKGLIVVSAHVGNWELAAHGLGTLGKTVKRVPINLVWFRNEGEQARRHLERVSSEQPFNIIDSRDSMQASIEMINALRRGEIVAIHGDRVTGGGTRVPFFGAPAEFPTGPYVVAASTGAPLVYVFANRQGACRYHVKVCGPVQCSYASRATRLKDLERWVADYASALEARLREYPLQWHNFFQFWS